MQSIFNKLLTEPREGLSSPWSGSGILTPSQIVLRLLLMKPLGKRNSSAPMNMNSMLEQAQKMQQSLLEIQEKLAEEVVEGSAGNGAVKVSLTGKHEVKSVKIQPEAVDADDLEMLEDLLVTAFNNAVEQANIRASEQMSSVTGGLPIPGLDSIF